MRARCHRCRVQSAVAAAATEAAATGGLHGKQRRGASQNIVPPEVVRDHGRLDQGLQRAAHLAGGVSEALQPAGMLSFCFSLIPAYRSMCKRPRQPHNCTIPENTRFSSASLDRVVQTMRNTHRRTGCLLQAPCSLQQRSMPPLPALPPAGSMLQHRRGRDAASFVALPNGVIWSFG